MDVREGWMVDNLTWNMAIENALHVCEEKPVSLRRESCCVDMTLLPKHGLFSIFIDNPLAHELYHIIHSSIFR